jgi:hypothetical protein
MYHEKLKIKMGMYPSQKGMIRVLSGKRNLHFCRGPDGTARAGSDAATLARQRGKALLQLRQWPGSLISTVGSH